MRINPVRTALLASAIFAIGMSLQSSESFAKRKYCDLSIKGSGRHSCQCDVLVNHRAPWNVLMFLSKVDACDSPKSGNGSEPILNHKMPPIDCGGEWDKKRMISCEE